MNDPHGSPAGWLSSSGPASTVGDRFTSREVYNFEVPSARDELWRMTPLRRLNGLHDGTARPIEHDLYVVPDELPPGVQVEVVQRDDQRLGVAVRPADRAAAQAWTDFSRALVITVADTYEVTNPVILTVTGPGKGQASYGHILIQVGRLSDATIIIRYRGSGSHADNVEVVTGPGSRLRTLFRHDWADDAVHLSAHHIQPGRDSVLRHASVTLNGAVMRCCPAVTFQEPGADAELTAIAFAVTGQHLEHRPVVDHSAPNCRSSIVFRGAAHGTGSRTVWIGEQMIRAGADGTDSFQVGKSILLTSQARADSVPKMEIETGAVARAGHASTTGRLDEGQLYYLTSRGITEPDARRMLVIGFFTSALEAVGLHAAQEEILGAIEAKLSAALK